MVVTALKPSTQPLVDQDELEYQIGMHLWLAASRRCACHAAPPGPRGSHYAWHIAHVAGVLVSEGFGRVRL